MMRFSVNLKATGEGMNQLVLMSIESRHYISTSLITFVVLFTLLTITSNGSAFYRPRAQTSAPQPIAQESRQVDVRELKPGAPIERGLAGGEGHSYSVMLTTGQYFHVAVEQEGIDVVVRLFDPNGQKLREVDNDPTVGSESVFVVAGTTGEYRVTVQSSDKAAKAGAYEIKIEELREGMSKDQVQLAAAKAFEEGNELRDQRTAESRRKAIKKYEEALPLWREVGDKKGEAYTLNELGVNHSILGEPKNAVEIYDQAVLVWRAVGDRLNEAITLTNQGIAYGKLGEPQKSLERHRQAFPLARIAGERQIEALTLNNIGSAYWLLGQPQEALPYYTQAMPLIEATGNRRQQAATLNNIGTIHQQLGDLQQALEYFGKSLLLRRAVRDVQGESTTLHNLGRIYDELGELQKALEYFTQALPLTQSVGDRQGEAVTLQSLSAIYLKLGELQKALEYSGKAVTLSRAMGDRRLEAYELNGVGRIYLRLGEPEKALAQFDQALSLARAVEDRLVEFNILDHIGDTYTTLKNPERALEYHHQALQLNRGFRQQIGEAATLFRIARAQSKLGNIRQARTQIEAALKITESTRTKITSRELRTSFLASNQDFYQLYVDLLMRMHQDEPAGGHDVAAFGASERARARGLLELLTEASIDVKQGIAPALKQRETHLQVQTSWVQRQLIQANSQAKPDHSRIASLEKQFKEVESESEQVETEIRQKHPRYATLRYPTPLGLKAIQQLLDEKTVLLEYSLGKEASFLFAISKNDFLTARLPAASLLTNQVMALREAVATKPDRTALSNYLQKAHPLYQDLVQPAHRLLSGKQSLIIVPDGILHYLPFELLLRSDSGRRAQLDLHQLPYLIRNYSISYSPSATVLANLRSSESPRQKPGKMFLAFGDPVYGKSESEQTSPVRSALHSAFGEGKPWELEPLPESRQEVQGIAKLYSPAQVDVFLGDQATEENLKGSDRPSQYRLVHFAVHGLLNENKPQYSGLVLSLPRDEKEKTETKKTVIADTVTSKGIVSNAKNATQGEDGLLQVYEIFNLKMNADLVVLSACETGLGKEIRGEGLVGLTQAFFYAGTSSMVVSLWKVQDRSTADLMGRFYRNLNNPLLNKSQALRQAQLEMISKGDFSHPYYWAGFVLIGQP